MKGLTFQNSQQMHFVISRSNSVRVNGVMVSSPEDSPNTDGIHITESTNVVLQDCKIGTGDSFTLCYVARALQKYRQYMSDSSKVVHFQRI